MRRRIRYNPSLQALSYEELFALGTPEAFAEVRRRVSSGARSNPYGLEIPVDPIPVRGPRRGGW